jgi:hypothetical protein
MVASSWVSFGRNGISSGGSKEQNDMTSDIPSFFYTLVYHLNVSKSISVEVLEKPHRALGDSSHPLENRVPEIVSCYDSLMLIPRKGCDVQQQTLQYPVLYSTAFLGQKCLCVLEQKLKPTTLSSYTSRQLRVSYLLIFGVILLVATAEPAVELPTFPEVSWIIIIRLYLDSTDQRSGRSKQKWKSKYAFRSVATTFV